MSREQDFADNEVLRASSHLDIKKLEDFVVALKRRMEVATQKPVFSVLEIRREGHIDWLVKDQWGQN